MRIVLNTSLKAKFKTYRTIAIDIGVVVGLATLACALRWYSFSVVLVLMLFPGIIVNHGLSGNIHSGFGDWRDLAVTGIGAWAIWLAIAITLAEIRQSLKRRKDDHAA